MLFCEISNVAPPVNISADAMIPNKAYILSLAHSYIVLRFRAWEEGIFEDK